MARAADVCGDGVPDGHQGFIGYLTLKARPLVQTIKVILREREGQTGRGLPAVIDGHYKTDMRNEQKKKKKKAYRESHMGGSNRGTDLYAF